jgi:hypothetical protein
MDSTFLIPEILTRIQFDVSDWLVEEKVQSYLRNHRSRNINFVMLNEQ